MDCTVGSKKYVPSDRTFLEPNIGYTMCEPYRGVELTCPHLRRCYRGMNYLECSHHQPAIQQFCPFLVCQPILIGPCAGHPSLCRAVAANWGKWVVRAQFTPVPTLNYSFRLICVGRPVWQRFFSSIFIVISSGCCVGSEHKLKTILLSAWNVFVSVRVVTRELG